MKTRKRKIVSSLPTGIEHRAAITSCPHCDHHLEKWEKVAVTLVLETVHGKHGSVVVVNECPECFKLSWVHQTFNYFEDWFNMYPKDWCAAATKEWGRRHRESVIRFADSLCARCVHLRELECDTLPIVRCTLGKPAPQGVPDYLHSCFTTTECKHFTPRTE